MKKEPAIKIDRDRLIIVWRDPSSLSPHPRNHRMHPKAQRELLRGALSDEGWIDPVILNRRTGRILDGHARVEEAIDQGVDEVPVIELDVDEVEECKILARHDRIGALAELNLSVLKDNLLDLGGRGIALDELGWDKIQLGAPMNADRLSGDQTSMIKEKYEILITCESELDQAQTLIKLQEVGIKSCRALIS